MMSSWLCNQSNSAAGYEINLFYSNCGHHVRIHNIRASRCNQVTNVFPKPDMCCFADLQWINIDSCAFPCKWWLESQWAFISVHTSPFTSSPFCSMICAFLNVNQYKCIVLSSRNIFNINLCNYEIIYMTLWHLQSGLHVINKEMQLYWLSWVPKTNNRTWAVNYWSKITHFKSV